MPFVLKRKNKNNPRKLGISEEFALNQNLKLQFVASKTFKVNLETKLTLMKNLKKKTVGEL